MGIFLFDHPDFRIRREKRDIPIFLYSMIAKENPASFSEAGESGAIR